MSFPDRFMCQNVHPLQEVRPWTSAPTLCIDPFELLEITLPSTLTLANHLLRPSNNISPGLSRPLSIKLPNGILGSIFLDWISHAFGDDSRKIFAHYHLGHRQISRKYVSRSIIYIFEKHCWKSWMVWLAWFKKWYERKIDFFEKLLIQKRHPKLIQN